MATRKAWARWEGSLQQGSGTMRPGSGAFEGAYPYSSRFEEGEGSNPEELIGAAHAGCFSGIDGDDFQRLAESANEGCPVSKALGAVDIQLDARLAGQGGG